MVRIRIICVGKVKEKPLRDMIAEYSKRLTRYCDLSITELKDEETPDNASPGEEELIKAKEGSRILNSLKDSEYVIALAIDGREMGSVELSQMMDSLAVKGESRICFIIGGSLGLSSEVLGRADMKLSFSKMTFPHQLMRVILLEQIYRSFRISCGEPYHK